MSVSARAGYQVAARAAALVVPLLAVAPSGQAVTTKLPTVDLATARGLARGGVLAQAGPAVSVTIRSWKGTTAPGAGATAGFFGSGDSTSISGTAICQAS
jgi:hypothetical protein